MQFWSVRHGGGVPRHTTASYIPGIILLYFLSILKRNPLNDEGPVGHDLSQNIL